MSKVIIPVTIEDDEGAYNDVDEHAHDKYHSFRNYDDFDSDHDYDTKTSTRQRPGPRPSQILLSEEI